MPTVGNIIRGLSRGANRHLRLTGKRGPRGFMTTKCQHTGYFRKSFYIIIPEKIPEIVVPSLKDCELKPYVSHRCPPRCRARSRQSRSSTSVWLPKSSKISKLGNMTT
ncbi:large ribosomal subunit protein mL41-like [Ptychodera flava]|uniref:large ribosomal subunit protein mL41-like n=1 Tax=Ptychodera flava TaxID=63121 RepID=UPI00396A6BE4